MALGLPQMRFDIYARDRSGPAWRGVENSIQRTQRSLAGFLRMAAPLLGVGGAAIGGTALAYMARDALDFADALVQAADRTSFAVEELEALRYAGRLNRVQFTQTDMAMQRFSRRLAEAASGSGELANDLEALNIPLRDANGQMRSSYDILLDYADAVQDAESEQEQLRLAFRAFDSEGAALVTVLRQGSEGLREYRQEAEDADAIMGDSLARSAAEAATALERMNLQITADRNRVIAENAEELQLLAEALGDIVTAAIEAGAALGRFYEGIGTTFATEQFQPFTESQLRREIENVAELTESFQRAYQSGTRVGGRLPGRLTRYLGEEEVARIRDEHGVLGDLDTVGPIYEALLARYRELRLRLHELETEGDTPPGSGARQLSETDIVPRINPRRLLAEDDEEDVKEALRAAFAAASDSVVQDFEQKATEVFRKEEKDLFNFEELAEARDDFARGFADAFAGGVMAAFDGDLQEYIAQRLRQAAYNGLYEAFERLGEVVFDRGTSGDQNGGGIIQAGISFLSGNFGGKRAAGGPVQPGKFYQWQENGREFFAPTVPGEVIPSGAPMSGGQTVFQQHFHLHAEGAVMTDELLKEMDDKANRAASSASAHAQKQMNDRAREQRLSFTR